MDARKGDPKLFDISAYVGAIKRTVAEKAAIGGSVNIFTNGDLIVRDTAVIDVSGGGYRYSAGRLDTTRLIGADGRLYDISDAPRDLDVQALFNGTYSVTDPKWGVTTTYASLVPTASPIEAGAIEGKSAGELALAAGHLVLEGSLRGGATAGSLQLNEGHLPTAGRLILGNSSIRIPGAAVSLGDVVFGGAAARLPAGFQFGDALPVELAQRLVVPTTLVGPGGTAPTGNYVFDRFGSVTVYATGEVRVPAGVDLVLPGRGGFAAFADRIDVGGTIRAPGGIIELDASQLFAGSDQTVLLRPGSVLSAAGTWQNAVAGAAQGFVAPPVYDGGSITVAGSNLLLESASRLDVSGGARLNGGRAAEVGDSGSISLQLRAYNDADASGDYGRFDLASELRGYSAGKGGRLALFSERLRVGDRPSASPSELVIDPALLQRGGFSTFVLGAQFETIVDAGIATEIHAQQLFVDATRNPGLAFSYEFSTFSSPRYGELSQRAPTSLTLSSASRTSGGVFVGNGARVSLEPGAVVSMSAGMQVRIDGSVIAHGGSVGISVQRNNISGDGIVLGADGVIDVSGTALPLPSPNPSVAFARVLSGGTVTLSTLKGGIQLVAGSVIDVSGAAPVVVDLLQTGSALGGQGYVRQSIGSEAGTIQLAATEVSRLDATLRGRAAPGLAAGSFGLEFARHGDTSQTDLAHRIIVTQETIATGPAGGLTNAYLSADQLMDGGFGKIRIQSSEQVEFRGDVTLAADRSIRVDGQQITAAIGTEDITLNAPWILLSGRGDPLGSPYAPAPVIATRDGTGAFSANASDTLDLFGSLTLNGFGSVALGAQGDLRASGRFVSPTSGSQPDRIAGGLTTSADLSLRAAQVYPTTGSQFTFTVGRLAGGTTTVVPGGTLTLASSGRAAPVPLSAGGLIAFVADNIDQSGVVRAPLGQIDYRAGNSLRLDATSLSSTSASGLTVPYGETLDGRTWTFLIQSGSAVSAAFTAPSEKRIALAGSVVTVAAGARIDASGGGELQATEFIPGVGGSVDALLQPGVYAVLPSLGDDRAPIDPVFQAYSFTSLVTTRQDLGYSKDTSRYDSVYIAGGSGLPEGRYALLPGYYALLPGAFIVRPQTAGQFQNMAPGSTMGLSDGSVIVAGRLAIAGPDSMAPTWSGVAVQPGTFASRQSEYTITRSSFFAQQALAAGQAIPRVPDDAGTLVLAATQQLDFQGTFTGKAVNRGLGPRVDITGSRIAVVDRVGADPLLADYFQIESRLLSSFQADLLLGGTRRQTASGITVTVAASDVVIASRDDDLVGTGLLLTATGTLVVSDGAALRVNGAPGVGPGSVVRIDDTTSSSGAALWLSSSGPLRVDRGTRFDGSRGNLVVESGATLDAAAIALDATRSTVSSGQLLLPDAGHLSIAARRVLIGDAPAGLDGVRFTSAELAAFENLRTLALRSYTSIDTFEAVTLGSAELATLILDAAGVGGYSAAGGTAPAVTVEANHVTLTNTSGATFQQMQPAGGGALTLRGETIESGPGDFTLRGFATASLVARQELVTTGHGSLRSETALGIAACRLTATSRADSVIQAGLDGNLQSLTFTALTPVGALAASQSPAASLRLAGRSVTVGGRIDMRGGKVELTAMGTTAGDDLRLTESARIEAGGYDQAIQGTSALAPAGSILLSAGRNVEVAEGAMLSVAGPADAGRIAVVAGGTVAFAGQAAGSGGDGSAQGSFQVDAGGVDGFGGLMRMLDANGFGERRDVRVRTGDLLIDDTTAIVARSINLAADQGAIVVVGRVDAGGGSTPSEVRLSASGDITLAAGSTIAANGGARSGPAPNSGNGGRVTIETRGGAIAFANGAAIDLSAGPSAGSRAGTVTFAAPVITNRNGLADVAMTLAGTIAANGPDGGGKVIVEGVIVQTQILDTSGAADPFGAIGNRYREFSAAAAGIESALQLQGVSADRIEVRAAIELQSLTGDMNVTSDWNLLDPVWNENGVAGRLTLRAGGNLGVYAALGLPDGMTPLKGVSTWTIELVGGADFTAADRLAVRSPTASQTSGDVVIGRTSGLESVGKVRTGDGDIAIAAARDVRLTTADAVIYTTGQGRDHSLKVFDPINGTEPEIGFGQYGGSISIAAGRDVEGVSPGTSVNGWLRRSTDDPFNGIALDVGGPAGWWSYLAFFRHSVGSFGGGDVSVTAGRDLDNLSVVAPSYRFPYSHPPAEGALPPGGGGGNIDLQAGRDVIAGEYLVGLGEGRIRAGGAAGASSVDGSAAPSGYFLLGLGPDATREGAHFDVAAGLDVRVRNVSNPTIMGLPRVDGDVVVGIGFGNSSGAFLSYSASSAFSAVSTSGSIQFDTLAPIYPSAPFPPVLPTWSNILPPSISLMALGGTVRSSGSPTGGGLAYLYPGSRVITDGVAGVRVLSGEVTLLALNAVENVALYASDVSEAVLPTAERLVRVDGSGTVQSSALPIGGVLVNRIVQPRSSADRRPYVVATASGDIRDSYFFFPQASSVTAGRDINTVLMSLQNLTDDGLTVVRAQRDFLYADRTASGQTLTSGSVGTTIGGPGRILVQAGRNIDLGISLGIRAVGDGNNANNLPTSRSAKITVAAGARGAIPLDRLDAFFARLLEAGKARDTAAANAAIGEIFPAGSFGPGDVTMFATAITTSGGSGIDILAPGGDINAGLPRALGGDLGVYTVLGGAIRSYLSGNFNVNQSKVVTLQGGDILLYTSGGNIDAGRGARASRLTQPPRRVAVLDGNGNYTGLRTFVPAQDAQGSGIRTLSSDPDGPGLLAAPAPGDVYLFAPRGFVDAGEAGVSSAGNLFVAAQQVLNASNFSSVGQSTGVPSLAPVSIAAGAIGATNVTSSVTKSADDAVSDATRRAAPQKTPTPSFITVEVLGFGDESDERRRRDAEGR